MIDAPPVAPRPLDERGMAARPPFLVMRLRADDRIVRTVLPRPVDRARSRGNDHMPRGRPRRAADRSDHVEPGAAPEDLRSLGRETLDHPVGGIMPGVVDMLGLANAAKPIVRQAHAVAA